MQQSSQDCFVKSDQTKEVQDLQLSFGRSEIPRKVLKNLCNVFDFKKLENIDGEVKYVMNSKLNKMDAYYNGKRLLGDFIINQNSILSISESRIINCVPVNNLGQVKYMICWVGNIKDGKVVSEYLVDIYPKKNTVSRICEESSPIYSCMKLENGSISRVYDRGNGDHTIIGTDGYLLYENYLKDFFALRENANAPFELKRSVWPFSKEEVFGPISEDELSNILNQNSNSVKQFALDDLKNLIKDDKIYQRIVNYKF